MGDDHGYALGIGIDAGDQMSGTTIDDAPRSRTYQWSEGPTCTAEGLLDARQLLIAIAGNLEGGCPLIGWARELADLHATMLTASFYASRLAADFDGARTRTQISEFIGEINRWAILHLPRPVNARRHTHSLGEVISHIAHTYAQMMWTLRHSEGAQNQHEAALHLAQAQEGYADLVAEIRGLRVQLPLGWRGIPVT
ncbi:hypothetical protein [Nocardia asteroides]|uniref:hypothetical protein n=1 Tax=Nocardia asteroides TaxID=1824 RepID=UPI0033C3BD20